MMQAREQVKAELRRLGFIPNSVKAADIGRAAQALLKAWDPEDGYREITNRRTS
jgi:hypothetical protein